MNTKREQFEQLISIPSFSDDRALLEFFDTLEPVSVEDMIGRWQGGDFETGHWGTPALKDMNWFGKEFKSDMDGHPLICYNEEGKLFSNMIMNGASSLWMVEFRGKVSATMIYDGVPIFDHFRKVDDDTIMGVMNGKQAGPYPPVINNGRYYFFYLKRITEWPVPFVESNEN